MLPLTVGHEEVSLSYDNKFMSRVVMPAAGLSEASILYIKIRLKGKHTPPTQTKTSFCFKSQFAQPCPVAILVSTLNSELGTAQPQLVLIFVVILTT